MVPGLRLKDNWLCRIISVLTLLNWDICKLSVHLCFHSSICGIDIIISFYSKNSETSTERKYPQNEQMSKYSWYVIHYYDSWKDIQLDIPKNNILGRLSWKCPNTRDKKDHWHIIPFPLAGNDTDSHYTWDYIWMIPFTVIAMMPQTQWKWNFSMNTQSDVRENSNECIMSQTV